MSVELHDDRGRALVPPGEEILSAKTLGEPLLEWALTLRRRAVERQRFTWVDLSAMILPLLSLPVLTVLSGMGPRRELVGFALVWPGVVAGWKTLRWRERNTEARIARGLVDAGYCGACVYPLEGLPPHADACVVCPECGAAWRWECQVTTTPPKITASTGLPPNS